MRWIFRILGVVVLLAMLAVGALFVLPTDRIAELAATRISAELGREVRLDGAVRPTLWPQLGVRAERLTIGNPDWVEDGPLIAADALSVRVPWTAVFGGDLAVDEVTLVAPQITLVRAADGRTSWDFTPVADPAEPQEAATGDTARDARNITITAARIENGSLLFRDDASGDAFRLAEVNADLALPQDAPATVAMTATLNGTALDLDAAIAEMDGLIGGAVSPVALSLGWSAGQASFDGQMSLDPALDGTVAIDASDFGPLAAILGLDLPDLPEGYGRERVVLNGEATLASEGSAHLRDARLSLDQTDLVLSLDFLPGEERPMIRGTVSGQRLIVPASTGGDSGGTAGSGGGTGWPTDAIDVAGLFAADAEIALAVQAVEAGGLDIGPVDLRATLTGGRLVFDIDSIGAYGGTLTGQFVVNGRSGLSVGGDLLLAAVQLSPLLTDLAGYERLNGNGSASLQFLGVSNDMATIMSSLSGEGDLAFGAGAIEGLDIAGMIRNLDTSFQGDGARTVYDSVTANFTIADGVLSNDDLLLDAPWGEVTGAGRVDLGGQTLDYRVIPGVMRGQDGAATIRVPVLITGPWSDPSFRPDLEYLAEQEFAEQREQLEAETNRLEAEARQRANDLLGTELEEGDTVDDAREALEQRLLDEAEGGLLRLFERN